MYVKQNLTFQVFKNDSCQTLKWLSQMLHICIIKASLIIRLIHTSKDAQCRCNHQQFVQKPTTIQLYNSEHICFSLMKEIANNFKLPQCHLVTVIFPHFSWTIQLQTQVYGKQNIIQNHSNAYNLSCPRTYSPYCQRKNALQNCLPSVLAIFVCFFALLR